MTLMQFAVLVLHAWIASQHLTGIALLKCAFLGVEVLKLQQTHVPQGSNGIVR